MLLAVAALLPGCSSESSHLTVFAASSLADAFQELGDAFQQEHPGVEIAFNFAGSSTLRTQLELGARADIFVSADTRQMELAQRAGVVEEAPQVFATNSLVLVTYAGSLEVRVLQDLSKPGVRFPSLLPGTVENRSGTQRRHLSAVQNHFAVDDHKVYAVGILMGLAELRAVDDRVRIKNSHVGLHAGPQ